MEDTRNQNDGSDLRGTKRAEFLAGEDSSKSSPSSIGTPSDSEEDEVQSNSNPRTGLDSLDSLQDSLPINKGLSIHFDGKSKSFTDLSSANELKKKQENPTNKRRRILTSSRWSRRASLLYNCPDPNSMPLLPLPDKEEEKYREQLASPSSSSLPFSSSLTEGKKQEDDQQHDQEEDA